VSVLERGTGDHSAPDRERDSKQSELRNADGPGRAAHDAAKSVPQKREARHDSGFGGPRLNSGSFL